MSSMTFIINDQTTESLPTNPRVQVTITECADGTLKFDIIQLGGVNAYLGDLRGFFFDIVRESLINTLCVTNVSGGTLTELQRKEDAVVDLGDGANMNGLTGTGTGTGTGIVTESKGYDVGIEIGTQGIGSNGDDVREFHFTLSSSYGPLTLNDFSNVNFGIRITSIGRDTNGDGIIDTSRSASTKILEGAAATAGNNATVQLDDDALSGGNSGGTDDDADPANATGTLAHTYGGSGTGTTLAIGDRRARGLHLHVE